MHVSKIQNLYTYNYKNLKYNKLSNNLTYPEAPAINYTKLPTGIHYGNNITFGEFFDPNRTVPHIDYEEYMAMTSATKSRYRKKYHNYAKSMNKSEMFDPKANYMPLASEKSMEEFIKTASIYKKYKNQPILCLGRSPKWFLNAALWMKDGIDNYKFVAFSKFWFWPDKTEGMRKMPSVAPTEKEIKAYHKYLKDLHVDPQHIVNHHQKTGAKTVITDYITTGKGATSFLDVMSELAEKQGVLEDFSKAIQIVGIGSLQYLESFFPEDVDISVPEVIMPPKLKKYSKNIEQTYYNMDFNMFREMLINQNTNECRSTYYPHDAWTVYRPDRFKTGLIKDMKKVKERIRTLNSKQSFASFTPAMLDFRNLLNFRILDALNHRHLLKAVHHSKL